MNASFDQPLIAIDVVPVSFSTVDGVRFGLATRQYDPYAGALALPGVLLNGGERIDAAAYRALSAKAGIGRDQIRHLSQIGAFDGPGRDPRDHAISVSYLAAVEPDVDGVTWEQTPQSLPFDHDSIVAAASEQLRVRLWSDTDLTRALLGETFTTVDVVNLETQLTGTRPHQPNVLRRLTSDQRLSRAAEGRTSQRGKPIAVFSWV